MIGTLSVIIRRFTDWICGWGLASRAGYWEAVAEVLAAYLRGVGYSCPGVKKSWAGVRAGICGVYPTFTPARS